LLKYSILEVIYFDEKGSVLREYNYKSATDEETFKCSFPILKNTIEEKILLACFDT